MVRLTRARRNEIKGMVFKLDGKYVRVLRVSLDKENVLIQRSLASGIIRNNPRVDKVHPTALGVLGWDDE